jgi:replicative DNA helicase
MNLPTSPTAERALLGCLLLDAKAALPELLARHPDPARYFDDERHTQIFETITTLAQAGRPVDTATVGLAMKTDGEDLAYLGGLPDASPSPANVVYFADELREAWTKRQVAAVCASAMAKAQDGAPADDLLAKLQADVLALAGQTVGNADFTVKEGLRAVVDELEAAHTNKGRLRGLATGFARLDSITRGLRPGQLVVIGARPATGKTSLAMNIAEHVAVDQGKPVLVFSLEMTKQELLHRMTLSRAKIPATRAEMGELTASEIQSITNTTAAIAKAPLRICDFAAIPLHRLAVIARRTAFEYHNALALVIVDYIQLMKPGTNRKDGNRNLEMAEISGGLKALAKEVALPVIALSQLSRDHDRDGRQPRLSDLRDSGAIEQDADLVALLHSEKPDDDPALVNVIVAKNRTGPTGKFPLRFRKSFTRFEDT